MSLATLRKEVDILKQKKSSIEEEQVSEINYFLIRCERNSCSVYLQKQAAADQLSLPGSSADMKVKILVYFLLYFTDLIYTKFFACCIS